jgi:hypothetical protein
MAITGEITNLNSWQHEFQDESIMLKVDISVRGKSVCLSKAAQLVRLFLYISVITLTLVISHVLSQVVP